MGYIKMLTDKVTTTLPLCEGTSQRRNKLFYQLLLFPEEKSTVD